MEYSKREKLILRELSNDARISVSRLAEIAGCSRLTAKRIVNELTGDLGIRFVLELDENRLGARERHLIAVSFSKRPPEKELAEFFAGDVNAQEAYLTEGSFDLVVYATATRPEDYIIWETRIATHFSDYGVMIRPSEFVLSHFGYLPLSSKLIHMVDKESGIDDKDKLILESLNEDSRMSLSELSRRTGMSGNVIRYRIFMLQKSGVIKRFTIAMQRPEGHVSLFYMINYRFTKTTTNVAFASAREFYMGIDGDLPLINTFQFVAPVSGSFRSFGMVCAPDEKSAMEYAVKRHKVIFRNEDAEIKYAVVRKVLKGLLPIRNLDMRQNYRKIEWV